jgi:hypothetical protein
MFTKVPGMHRKQLLALSLLAMWNNALADWVAISIGDARAPTIYIGDKTVLPESHIAGMSILEDYSNPQHVEESPEPMMYMSVARRFEYDCRSRQQRLISFTFYAGRMGTGRVVLGDSHAESDWHKEDDETKNYFKLACGNTGK